MKIDITREELETLYIGQNMSYDVLSKYLGISVSSLKRYLKMYNITKNTELQKLNREKTCTAIYHCNNAMKNKAVAQKSQHNAKGVRRKNRSLSAQITNGETLSKEQIVYDYITCNTTRKDLCEKYHMSSTQFGRLLRYYGIRKDQRQALKNSSKANDRKNELVKNELITYLNSLESKPTLHDLAEHYDLSLTTVQVRVRRWQLQDKVLLWPFSSHYEKDICNFLDDNKISYIHNKRGLLDNNSEIDIYIPSKKIGIEFKESPKESPEL